MNDNFSKNAKASRQVDGSARQKIKARANRLAGQMGGIQRMIEENQYCVDILNQIAAVRSALDALGVEMLTAHLESCVLGHGTKRRQSRAKPMKPAELVAELRAALSRLLK